MCHASLPPTCARASACLVSICQQAIQQKEINTLDWQLATRHSQIATAHSLPGSDDITRQELSNSIVVVSRANFNSPSVVVSGYLPAGSLFDSNEKLGLADFTAQALMRGTIRRPFQEIYDALESAGASLGFSGGT